MKILRMESRLEQRKYNSTVQILVKKGEQRRVFGDSGGEEWRYGDKTRGECSIGTLEEAYRRYYTVLVYRHSTMITNWNRTTYLDYFN